MKENDVRIGNLVSRTVGIYERITGSVRVDFNVLKSIHLYDPIPLNKVWLQLFGFEEDGLAYKIKITYGYLLITFRMDYLKLYTQKSEYYTSIPPYVHQLQNLFFALTGEELTIKQTATAQ